jgi:hypothetical protein
MRTSQVIVLQVYLHLKPEVFDELLFNPRNNEYTNFYTDYINGVEIDKNNLVEPSS